MRLWVLIRATKSFALSQQEYSFYWSLWLFYRMTLLLGPPGSGKTTLLLALANKMDKALKVGDTWKIYFLCWKMLELQISGTRLQCSLVLNLLHQSNSDLEKCSPITRHFRKIHEHSSSKINYGADRFLSICKLWTKWKIGVLCTGIGEGNIQRTWNARVCATKDLCLHQSTRSSDGRIDC